MPERKREVVSETYTVKEREREKERETETYICRVRATEKEREGESKRERERVVVSNLTSNPRPTPSQKAQLNKTNPPPTPSQKQQQHHTCLYNTNIKPKTTSITGNKAQCHLPAATGEDSADPVWQVPMATHSAGGLLRGPHTFSR